MIYKTEFKVLELLFNDLTKEYSILELAKTLKLPYPQTHRAIKSLIKKDLVSFAEKGKALIISLDLTKIKKEYIAVELARREKALQKHGNLRILAEDLEKIMPVQFICIVFGSYAKSKPTKASDIDLLFVLPKEYDHGTFEKKVKNSLTISRTDINITTEQGLLEMWQKPGQLNVGTELLKGHITLKGAEAFLYLRKKYHVG